MNKTTTFIFIAILTASCGFGCRGDHDATVTPEQVPSSGFQDVKASVADLKDPNPIKREQAARELGASKDARAVVPLIAALRDSDSRVKTAVAGALGSIKDAR